MEEEEKKRERKERGKKRKRERKGMRKEKGKQKGGRVRESERKKRRREERKKKKKKGTTLPFTISGEPAVETHQGKRQSWSMQQELRVGIEIRVFHQSSKRYGFSPILVPLY